MGMKRIPVTLSVDDLGTTIVANTPKLNGEIMEIALDFGDLDATSDLTIATEESGVQVFNQANISADLVAAPRQPTHDAANAAALYATGGTNVRAPYCVADERLVVTLAQGGADNSGTLHIYIKE